MSAAAPALTPPADAAAVLRRHGRSFYFASHFLGRRHAGQAARLYAFCRHVDDLADEAPDPVAAGRALDTLHTAIREHHAIDPQCADLLNLADETGLDLNAALALIKGVRGDLEPVALADEAALLRYAYHVAGTVGVMMCAVLDVHESRALPFAIDLGIAMQLTNIARDVQEDGKAGRVYVPADWIGGASAASLAHPDEPLRPQIARAVQRLLALAEQYYASGEAGMGHLPPRARLAILVAARVYRAIGTRLAARGHAVWQGRAVVSGPVKVAVAARACADYAARRSLHSRSAAHDARLHAALRGLAGANPPTELKR